MTLPNALIGGAPKCGTTSLADALAAHPDVYIPYKKELSFFHADSTYKLGLDWYKDFFGKGKDKALRLEATPDYLASEDACSRIREHIPECKLVFLVRDPVTRAHSHYWFRARSGREHRGLIEALREEQREPGNPSNYLIRYGQYSAQLQRYFDTFPREQILVLRFSALTAAPEGSLRRAQEFLGVPAIVTTLCQRNPASEARSKATQNLLRRITTDQGRLKQTIRAVVPPPVRYQIRRSLDRMNKKPAEKPPLGASAKKILVDAFARDIDELESLLGTSLEEWRAAWSRTP